MSRITFICDDDKEFKILKATLNNYPDSLLATMINTQIGNEESDKRYIDCDSKTFEHIVKFYRFNIIPKEFDDDLQNIFNYYQLPWQMIIKQKEDEIAQQQAIEDAEDIDEYLDPVFHIGGKQVKCKFLKKKIFELFTNITKSIIFKSKSMLNYTDMQRHTLIIDCYHANTMVQLLRNNDKVTAYYIGLFLKKNKISLDCYRVHQVNKTNSKHNFHYITIYENCSFKMSFGTLHYLSCYISITMTIP